MSDFTPLEPTGHLASEGSRCPECPVGVPSRFPSQNGTSRECPVIGCVVSRAPRSKGAGHGTVRGTARALRTAYLTKHHCGADLLAGLDDDVAGLMARCDPYPLSPLGEVEALTAGRATWYLRHRRLERRDQFTIPGHPPCPDLLVLTEHRCGEPPPTIWLLPPSPPRPRPATPEEF